MTTKYLKDLNPPSSLLRWAISYQKMSKLKARELKDKLESLGFDHSVQVLSSLTETQSAWPLSLVDEWLERDWTTDLGAFGKKILIGKWDAFLRGYTFLLLRYTGQVQAKLGGHVMLASLQETQARRKEEWGCMEPSEIGGNYTLLAHEDIQNDENFYERKSGILQSLVRRKEDFVVPNFAQGYGIEGVPDASTMKCRLVHLVAILGEVIFFHLTDLEKLGWFFDQELVKRGDRPAFRTSCSTGGFVTYLEICLQLSSDRIYTVPPDHPFWAENGLTFNPQIHVDWRQSVPQLIQAFQVPSMSQD